MDPLCSSSAISAVLGLVQSIGDMMRVFETAKDASDSRLAIFEFLVETEDLTKLYSASSSNLEDLMDLKTEYAAFTMLSVLYSHH
jgi:hypothetical protein